MPRIRKKTSKRVTTHQRSKLNHKVSESRKKKKKEAKKSVEWKSKKKKDPGIPNNFPFKDQIIAEMQENKRLTEERKQKRKAEKTALKKAEPADPTATQDVEMSTTSQQQSTSKSKTASDAVPLLRDSTIPDLASVLEEAQVMVQVLDARNPLAYRSRWLENNFLARQGNRRLAFILNKIDLVPREAAEQWLQYLRCEAPTLPFSATLDGGVGVEGLRNWLTVWSTESGLSGPLKVAIVGLVNSGKSTIINSLAGEDSLPVYQSHKGSNGFSTTKYPSRIDITLETQTVQLIDTPGVMRHRPAPGSATPEEVELIRVRDILYRNRGQVHRLHDPTPPIKYVLAQSNPQDLMLLYNLPAFKKEDTDAFLRALARMKGFVKKRGDLDLDGAARQVLKEWSQLNFPYFSLPPSPLATATSNPLGAEFDETALSTLKRRKQVLSTRSFVEFTPETINEFEVILDSKAADDEEESEDEDEDDNDDAGTSSEREAEYSDDDEGSEANHSDSDAQESSEPDSAREDTPAKTLKRKRFEQLPLPDRSKKVTFAPAPSKKTKPETKAKAPLSKPAAKAKSALKPTKRSLGKVGNLPSSGKGQAQKAGELEIYDFGRYF